MKIHIDNRESKVIPYFKDVEGIDKEESTLKRGDYVISYNEQILHLFERKSMGDLVYSLKTHNLHIENMIYAREETNCKLGYILEHKRVFYDDDTVVKGIEWSKLRALLDTIYLKYDIPIILTKDPSDTALRITQFAQRYQRLIKQGMTFNIKGGLNLLTDKVEKTIDEEVLKLWMSMPGIGKETAEALIKRFSFIELLTVDLSEVQNTELNGKIIGKRLDKTINEYQGPNSPLHRKILTGINGISETRALRILKNNEFKNLMNTDIASIEINNKKLGDKIDARIKGLLSYKYSQ